MATTVNTDYATNLPWNGWKNGHNEWLITLLESGVAKDLTDYTFRLDIYANHEGSNNPRLSLTQGSGLTNGTTAGTIRNILTQTQSGTTLPGNDYYYILSYTINSKTFALYKGTLTLGARNNPASPTSSTSANVTMVGADGSFTAVTANVTLAGESGGGSWGEIEGTLSDQTDLQAELDEKVNAAGSDTKLIRFTGTPALYAGVRIAAGAVELFWGPNATSYDTATNAIKVSNTGIFYKGLPTSDPATANELWNDNGTIKISAG